MRIAEYHYFIAGVRCLFFQVFKIHPIFAINKFEWIFDHLPVIASNHHSEFKKARGLNNNAISLFGMLID